MISQMKVQLDQDYNYCENIIRQYSNSFYYTFKQLPEEKARAVFAIYAFCRSADDILDQALLTKEEKVQQLQQLENDLRSFEHFEEKSTPLWRALRDVFNRYPMKIEPFYHQIQGQKMDIHFNAMNTIDDVEIYSYLVAGSVGLMLLPILTDEVKPEAEKAAVQLGIALQITNILRDIGEDFDMLERVYLPVSEMNRFNYSMRELEKHIINDSFIQLWERLAGRAEEQYDFFEDHISLFAADSRFQVLMAARVYRQYLSIIRHKNYDCFTEKSSIKRSDVERIVSLTMIEFESKRERSGSR